MHTRAAFLAAAVVAAVSVGLAAPAIADPNDEQFINTLTLHEMGCTALSFVKCTNGEQDLVDMGHDICVIRSHMSEANTPLQR